MRNVHAGVDYQLVTGVSAYELVMHVNEQMERGWVPQGGVATFYHPHHQQTCYTQAMVRRAE